MRILLISYGNYHYDGRLRALINVFSKIGDLTCFLQEGPKEEGIKTCNASYPVFIASAIGYAKQMQLLDILVLDNRKATIPGLAIQALIKPKVTILDCREFYRIEETGHLAGKIGCIFERMMIHWADIIVAANEERANLMREEYGLLETPLIYENLRQLQYDSLEGKNEAAKKINRLLGDGDCIRIISSSGCSVERTNDILVRNLPKVGKKIRLFLVGHNNEKDKRLIKELADRDNLNEIVITGNLNQSELKYLISRCDIGIVNYGQYDTNNKYCASGKLYEFVYEGIPIVTTTNPSLKRICDTYQIGVSDDEYFCGIQTVMENYDYFKKNAVDYARQYTVEENNRKMVLSIRDRLQRFGI